MPAPRKYKTEEEREAAKRESYRKYRESEKGKATKERFKEKNKDNVELKERYYKVQRDWFRNLSDAERDKIKARNRVKQQLRLLNDPRIGLFNDAKKRAKKKCLDFTITLDDIIIPAVCPVLGIQLFRGDGKQSDNSPSLDRINNNVGYIPGNVRVISYRANTIKSSSTVEELLLIIAYMQEVSYNGLVRD